MNFIPLCVPLLEGNEMAYLKDCVETSWVSYAGSYVTRLEQMMAEYVGTAHAVATNSGTSALHTALLVAGIRPGDEVLVSDLTFIAPANAIRYCGAFPVFIDVTADFWQMDPQKVKDFLQGCQSRDGKLYNPATGRPVTAIVPVHILGHGCELGPLLELARHYGLKLIEDASETLGGEYQGLRLGSLGDLACFSYNGNKIITTGGGGMIVTNNAQWAERAKYLTTQARDDAFEYVHDSVGYNYRLTNLQAAVGVAQMEKLPEYVERKRAIARRYQEGLRGVVTMPEAPWCRSAFWQYTVLVKGDRKRIHAALGAERIQTRPLWVPLHRLPPFRDCPHHQVEVAENLHRQAISIPCSVGLGEEDQARVIEAVNRLA